MRFIINVTPGDYTNEADLALMGENIRLSLNTAVNDVANNMFPEYVFGEVTDADTETEDEHAERVADEAYAARHARTETPADSPACTVCGGKLETSEQYPEAGYLHTNDADDTHVPQL